MTHCVSRAELVLRLRGEEMEVWCAYKADASSYSGASHVQVGSFQASNKDVSATDGMASAESLEVEVSIAEGYLSLAGTVLL